MSRRFVFSAALLLGCGSAWAGWVKVASDEAVVFYVESAMSRKVQGHVMVSVLRDYAVPRHDQAYAYLSSRDEMEVDCPGGRVRRSYCADHPQHMGLGQPVHAEYGPMSWNFAAPNTILRRIVGIACANPRVE